MLALALALLLTADPDVWSGSLSVGPGQTRTLKAKGLTPGERYELVTRGECSHLGKGKAKKWRDAVSPEVTKPFGVDFRVKIGAQEFTVDADERHALFGASEAEPEVTVTDHSATSTEARCTLTSVRIRKR
jgi:hypothetical protein